MTLTNLFGVHVKPELLTVPHWMNRHRGVKPVMRVVSARVLQLRVVHHSLYKSPLWGSFCWGRMLPRRSSAGRRGQTRMALS